jgi:hypothetical protein
LRIDVLLFVVPPGNNNILAPPDCVAARSSLRFFCRHVAARCLGMLHSLILGTTTYFASQARRSLAVAAIITLLTGTSIIAAPPRRGPDLSKLPEPLNRPVKYFGDVHPILATHCLSCHGQTDQKGGLRLDSRQAAMAGGSSYGPAIEPGNSAQSPLILLAAHLEGGMEMPPEGPPLSEEQIATLRAWIDQGAPWPRPRATQEAESPGGAVATLGNQPLFFEQAKTHWAYQPIPRWQSIAGSHNGAALIDRLIAETLAGHALTASPIAEPRVLIRRLHFDLVGLPPTAEEVAAFEADPSPQAYAQLVDRLLQSPHFGQRWGRYWLDIARYADTRDFQAQADLRYPFAWTYRDYVVAAFSDDKPYDRFITEQLAADQLDLEADDPALAALGFLTVGPRFRGRVDEIINDRIDVMTRGLMGMTVACARCHDHKYDPIPTADFYSLYGVLASSEDADELPEIRLPGGEVPEPLREDYEKKIAAAKGEITAFLEGLKSTAIADILAKPVLYFDAIEQMEVSRTADVRKLITGKHMVETALTPLAGAYAALKREPKWREDPLVGPLALSAATPAGRRSAVIKTMLRTGRLPAGGPEVHPALLDALRKAADADGELDEGAVLQVYGRWLAQAVQTQSDKAATVTESEAESADEMVAALCGEGGWFDFPLDSIERAHRLLGTGRRQLNELHTAVSEIDATHPGAPPRAMAVFDKPSPVTPVIFIRGEPGRRGDAVERRFPEVLDPSKTPFSPERSGRRELAAKIVSRENPLTARVWANHIWRHLIGRPLVETPGDFGLQAQPPKHPELLDALAAALADRDWSTKELIRDIVMSETYRQQSDHRDDCAAVDPENTLVWRANRRRMDFEAMRDAILTTSGRLDATIGGRAVHLSSEPFSNRRTIYGFVDRVNLDPLFTTFDFPSPDISSPERSETLVPQQALFALNDPFIIEQARALVKLINVPPTASSDRDLPAAAVRVKRNSPDATSDVQQTHASIARLYQRVFLRAASPEEIELAAEFLHQAASAPTAQRRGQWLYGYGSNDPSLRPGERFRRLPYFDVERKRYQASRIFPDPELSFVNVSAVGGTPGANHQTAAIRRWLAPYDGEFEISGEISLVRQNNGDGVQASIISSRAGLLGHWVVDGEVVTTSVEKVTLRAGEILDFVVDCRQRVASDAYRWSPTIRLIVKPEEAPVGVQSVWDAQSDFESPPPPPLRPLEQLAHALLMTNEFLFID